MLALFVTACPSFSLGQAKSRFGSDARSQFAAALPSCGRAFELAVLLAAEERPEDCVASISEEIDAGIRGFLENYFSAADARLEAMGAARKSP